MDRRLLLCADLSNRVVMTLSFIQVPAHSDDVCLTLGSGA